MPDESDLDVEDERYQATTARQKAVKWLDVRQLVRTSVDVVQASSFARFADNRESMVSSPREFYELAPPPGTDPVWVDYVSDAGDGFDATFATARCLTGAARVEPAYDFADRDRRPEPTADLLVLGGDLVYPVASMSGYEARFSSVLRRAAYRDAVTGVPPVLAMPGNHDWYDGLAAFRRLFCESHVRGDPAGDTRSGGRTPVPPAAQRGDVGGWGAFQSRSYFAVRLRPGWWLWAADGQLNAPIDAEQLSYFREAATLLADGEAIVLCTATPSWLEADGEQVYDAPADSPLFTTLWFVEQALGREQRHRIRLVLTGDQHHYARYSPRAAAAPELVTCGGGGAFLASTHHLPERLRLRLAPWARTRAPSATGPGDSAELTYDLTRCYPDKRTSRWVGWTRSPGALFANGWTLPVLLGVLTLPMYLAWALDAQNGMVRSKSFWVSLAVVAALLLAYSASGTKEWRAHPWRRRGLTVALATGHTTLYAGIAWLAATTMPFLLPGSTERNSLLWLLQVGALAAADVAVLGASGMIAFVYYLRVADRVCCHTLEAFSGLQIPDYKSHLRLLVAPDRLDVHVVGMDRVPRARRRARLGDAVPQARVVDRFSVSRIAPPTATQPRQADRHPRGRSSRPSTRSSTRHR